VQTAATPFWRGLATTALAELLVLSFFGNGNSSFAKVRARFFPLPVTCRLAARMNLISSRPKQRTAGVNSRSWVDFPPVSLVCRALGKANLTVNPPYHCTTRHETLQLWRAIAILSVPPGIPGNTETPNHRDTDDNAQTTQKILKLASIAPDGASRF